MRSRAEIIAWLMDGDPAIQYQTQRDLLNNDDPKLQARIARQGWGAAFLAERGAITPKHWGLRFYQPKWISTHYTLLDLKDLQISPDQPEIRESIELIAQENKAPDGGILPIGSTSASDGCINGMFLNYACYFQLEQKHLESVVDFTIDAKMGDGGFNCRFNRGGAVHSSMNTTISILEGIQEYDRAGYRYRLDELQAAAKEAQEFLLMHRLYKSDHTGEIIKKQFIMLSYPTRWYYDFLRALVYFADARVPYDERLQDALNLLHSKRRKDGTWPVQAKRPGKEHFQMEQRGRASRWNTLRALRVLDAYSI